MEDLFWSIVIVLFIVVITYKATKIGMIDN